MPFTFSHPAIILPFLKLNKKWFSATGLIIGSMAPDLEYFSRLRILATYGHQWLDGLFFNVLIALLYCFIFHLLVRNILIDHLPNFLFQRFSDFKKFDWINYVQHHSIILLVSIIIGIYSHLFWDAFTHEWGFFVQRIPFLQLTWFDFALEIKGYKFLQYFSSVIGLLVLMIWIYKKPFTIAESTYFDTKFWLNIFLFSGFIVFIRFYFFPIEIISGNLIVVPIMSVFISLMMFGLIQKIKKL